MSNSNEKYTWQKKFLEEGTTIVDIDLSAMLYTVASIILNEIEQSHIDIKNNMESRDNLFEGEYGDGYRAAVRDLVGQLGLTAPSNTSL